MATQRHPDSSHSSTTPPLPCIWLARQWRQPRLVLGLFIFELAPTIAGLALFGIADPDLYRTRLWEDGYLNGFNSSPGQVLLAYANHVPFTVPLVWSQFITTYNLVISVLSMFWLLVKSVAFVLHLWPPLVSLVVHSALFALYLFSVYAQTSPDKTDPAALQNGAPWYITHSCSVAFNPANIGYCKQAKAALAVTILMVILFFVNMCQSFVSCFPTRRERQVRQAEKIADEEEDDNAVGPGKRAARAPPVQQKAAFVAGRPFGFDTKQDIVRA